MILDAFSRNWLQSTKKRIGKTAISRCDSALVQIIEKHWGINVLRNRENAFKTPYKTNRNWTILNAFSRKWPQNTKKSIGKTAISRCDSAPAQIIEKALGNQRFAKAQKCIQNTL